MKMKKSSIEDEGDSAKNANTNVEDPADRKSRMRSIYIIHFAMLIFSLGFSIILTGVYPYLKQVSNDETKFIIKFTLLHRYGSKY
jgi:ceroid-lipofuscinosis MFS transporter 7